MPQSWSRDGAHLLFSVQKGSEFTLWLMTMRDRKVARFLEEPAREATFSPDGRWVAYQVRETANTVYVEPFPRSGAKYLASRRGGHPFWSPKGDEIFMNTAPSESTVVGFTTTPRVGFTRPAPFARQGRSEGDPQTERRNADMMPDGQRVIGVRAQGTAQGDSTITVVLNWFDELTQRVPAK